MQLRNLRAGAFRRHGRKKSPQYFADNPPSNFNVGDPEDALCRPTRGQHSLETSVTPTLDDLSCERTQIECLYKAVETTIALRPRNWSNWSILTSGWEIMLAKSDSSVSGQGRRLDRCVVMRLHIASHP